MPGESAIGKCSFGVTREGGGSGIVTVTKPDGGTRSIFFEKGKGIGFDFGRVNPGGFSLGRQGDSTVVFIGGERCEIPDAVVLVGDTSGAFDPLQSPIRVGA